MNAVTRKAISSIMDTLEEKKSELESLAEEEQEKYDNLPEGIQYSERGDKLQEAADNLQEYADSLQDVIDNLQCLIDNQ